MKKIILTKLLLLTISLAVFSQQNSNVKPPPAWGQYKKLSAYSPEPSKGMEFFDTLLFVLAPGEKRIMEIERGGGNEPSPAKVVMDLVINGIRKVPYYLSKLEKFEIADPPANSSPQTRAELDYLLQLQQQRSEEDIRASTFYASVYYNVGVRPGDNEYARHRRNLFHVGRSIGTWFNADSLPLTATLVANVWQDASYYIWKYKNYFLRIRPCKLEPKVKNTEETNWAAYPSGHATNSYVNAYLFSELIPEFSSFFVKDAYDMAHSREIIGVHYPSDSESGRLLAYQLVQRLLLKETFKKDFDAAKEEINKVKTTKGF
jgi:acid phosphatase (class A)